MIFVLFTEHHKTCAHRLQKSEIIVRYKRWIGKGFQRRRDSERPTSLRGAGLAPVGQKVGLTFPLRHQTRVVRPRMQTHPVISPKYCNQCTISESSAWITLYSTNLDHSRLSNLRTTKYAIKIKALCYRNDHALNTSLARRQFKYDRRNPWKSTAR